MAEWRNRIVETGMVDPATLVPNPKNYRRHPANQTGALAGVLDEIGWIAPVTVNRTTGRLVDGHARVELAIAQGGGSVPVQYVELNESEERLALATLDPLSALAEQDNAMLAALLAEVTTDDPDLRRMLDELNKGAGVYPTNPMGDVTPGMERKEELRKKWGVESGDLWALGNHRLACGDCTDAAVVAQVMGGFHATLVFNDPPYGVAIANKNKILNSMQPAARNENPIEDDALSAEDLKAALIPAFTLVRTMVMADDCSVMVTAPQGGELCAMMLAILAEAGLPIKHMLIWAKNQATFSFGRLDYEYQHEPILFTWGKRHKRPLLGAFKTSVWPIDKPRSSAEHPTMKPVALVENAILNHTDRGDIVFDGFVGSGTTIAACENLDRECRAIELEPGYVAIALERWAEATGRVPERLESIARESI